jgi:hypothetical protein
MLVVALAGMIRSESHPKGHLALEIKTGIACLVPSSGLAPFTHLVHALAA